MGLSAEYTTAGRVFGDSTAPAPVTEVPNIRSRHSVSLTNAVDDTCDDRLPCATKESGFELLPLDKLSGSTMLHCRRIMLVDVMTGCTAVSVDIASETRGRENNGTARPGVLQNRRSSTPSRNGREVVRRAPQYIKWTGEQISHGHNRVTMRGQTKEAASRSIGYPCDAAVSA